MGSERVWSKAFTFGAPREAFIFVKSPMSPAIDGGCKSYLLLFPFSYLIPVFNDTINDNTKQEKNF